MRENKIRLFVSSILLSIALVVGGCTAKDAGQQAQPSASQSNLSGEKNEMFTKLIKSMKNARSHLDSIITERTTESTIYLAAGETSYSIAPVIVAN